MEEQKNTDEMQIENGEEEKKILDPSKGSKGYDIIDLSFYKLNDSLAN